MGESSPPSDVDTLFKLPLGEFTSARNALAAQLKKSGRQTEASEVKALAKPSISAWAVNQLYWRHRGTFDRLMQAGEKLRSVHAARLAGDPARDAVAARREAVAKLTALAADVLRDGGYAATRDVMRRVTTTLDALSSYASMSDAPAAGRLADDVEPPGFGALGGVQTKPASTPTRRADPPRPAARRDEAERKAALAAAKTAVRKAKGTLSAARKRAERATGKLETAQSRAKAIERQRAQIEKQLARVSTDAAVALADAREAAASATAATHSADEAESALDVARRRLQQLTGDED